MSNTATSPWRHLTDWRFLAALVALIANDHWAKAAHPGLLTGKISDVAGLVVLPVLLATAARSVSRRASVTDHAPLLFSGLLLVAIKTSPVAAGFVESTLGVLTGRSQSIVVDPTDLVGLVGLVVAHRVIQNPRPVRLGRLGKPVRMFVFGVGLLACVATSSEEDSGWIDLEVTNDGAILASPDQGQSRTPIISIDGGLTWSDFDRSAEAENGAFSREFEIDRGPVCLSGDPTVCFRTIHEFGSSRIEESTNSTVTWTIVWNVETGAAWMNEKYGFGGSVGAHDIAVLEDDTVLVAAGFIEPLRRNPANGEWTPSVRDVRDIPVQYLLVALAVAFPLMGAVRLARSGQREAGLWFVGALFVSVCGLFAAGDAVGPGALFGFGVTVFVIGTLTALAMVRIADAPGGPPIMPYVAAAAAALAGLVAAPLVLFSQDLLSWSNAGLATVIAVVFGGVGAGFVGPPSPAKNTGGKNLPPPTLTNATTGTAPSGPTPRPPLPGDGVFISPSKEHLSKRARVLWSITPLTILPSIVIIFVILAGVASADLDTGTGPFLIMIAAVIIGTAATWIQWVARSCDQNLRWLWPRAVFAATITLAIAVALWVFVWSLLAILVTSALTEPLMRITQPRKPSPTS